MAETPDIQSLLAALPPDQLASAIVKAVNERPDSLPLSQALAVRLTNLHPPSQNYGHEVVDTLQREEGDTGHKAYHMSVYPQITGGAVDVVIARDKEGETYILLGKKRDDAQPSEEAWRLPGGFMNPKPADSAQGVYPKGNKLVQVPKVYDEANPGPVAFDASLEDTAVRKLKERTGLDISKAQLTLIDSITDTLPRREQGGAFPLQQDGSPYPSYQQQVNGYLVQLPKEVALPTIKPQAEFAETVWANLADIAPEVTQDGKRGYSYNGRKLLEDYVPTIEKAVTSMRDQHIEEIGVEPRAVERQVPETKPEAVLGAEADAYHQSALCTAVEMKEVLDK